MVIRPNLSGSIRGTIAGMADIYGYAHQKEAGQMSVLTLRDSSGAIDCGCRFKYIPEEITLNYDNLVNAIVDAIDKESKENGGELTTDQRATVASAPTYDHAKLVEEFQGLTAELMEKNPHVNGPKIVSIVDKLLGKGKKVSETNSNQAEIVYLIVQEIKDSLM